MKKIFWTLSLILWNISFTQPVDSLFNQANQFYQQGDFEKALELYRQIPAQGYHSADLYFNMANAYYKLNRIPQAVYYYEKALKLRPGEKDIQHNLEIARRGLQDRIQPLPESLMNKVRKKIYMTFSPGTWGWLSVITLILAWLAFVIYLFSYKPAVKRLFFTLFILFLILWPAFWQAGYLARRERSRTFAIIMSPKTELYTGPAFSSGKKGVLHEGFKVEIIDTYGDWYKIRLPDGKTAWVAASEIKKI